MLKYEGIAIGTIIKAYDFEPMPGRTDRFVVGTIIDLEAPDGCEYASFYHIICDKDSSFGPGYSRVGIDIYVPMEMGMDFDGRIVEMSQPLELKPV